MKPTKRALATGMSAILALTAVGCSATSDSEKIPFTDLLGNTSALEPNPIDDVAELAERSEVLVVGTVTSIEIGEPVMATPDPNDPTATYGGQRVFATVSPADGSAPVTVEFIYQFAAGGELESPGQVALPAEKLVLGLVSSSDGSTYYCVADSQWCPLVWSGSGLASAAWQGGDVPLIADSTTEPESLEDALDLIAEETGTEVVG